MELNSFEWIPAYFDENKRCSLLGDWKGIAGVYFLKEKEEIVYIGMSLSDLKKTLYRHFQRWNDYRYSYYPYGTIPPYKRPSYSNREDFTISVIITDDCLELEKHFINKYQPRDNREKYLLYKRDELLIETIENNSIYLSEIESEEIYSFDEEPPF